MKGGQNAIVAALVLAIGACGGNEAAFENAADTIENIGRDARASAENTIERPVTETVFCPVVDRRLPKKDCDDLAAIESQVKEGTGAFNVPDPMTLGEAATIVLVVDRRTPEQISAIEATRNEASELSATENAIDANPSETAQMPINAAEADDETEIDTNAVAAANGGPTPADRVDPFEGETETIDPQVGRFMSADLIGEGFEITALTPASQEIPPGEHATWQWRVVPQREGARTLTLKTIVEGVIDNQRYPLARTETSKTVTVQVTAGDRIAGWIDAAIAWLDRMKLLLLAIAGVLGAAWLVRRNFKGRGNKRDADK